MDINTRISIAIILFFILCVGWFLANRKRFDDYLHEAGVDMKSIGEALDCRFDALDEAWGAAVEFVTEADQAQMKGLLRRRISINEGSSPSSVRTQDGILKDAKAVLDRAAEAQPELKESEEYKQYLEKDGEYAQQYLAATLMYNDSLNRYNRTIHFFPTNLAAKLMGYEKKEFLQ